MFSSRGRLSGEASKVPPAVTEEALA
jgi:hypothetical protein